MKKRNRGGDRRKPATVVAKELCINDIHNINLKKEKIKKMIHTYGLNEDKWNVIVQGRSIGAMSNGSLVLILHVSVTVNDPLGVLTLSGYGSCLIGNVKVSHSPDDEIIFSYNPDAYDHAFISAITDAVDQIL